MRALACTLAIAAALPPARGYAQDARTTTEAPAQSASPAKEKPKAGDGNADAKAKAEEPADAAARARVFEVLREVADEAPRWKDDAAAASVQAQVADLTWERDAGSARAVLARAWESARRAPKSQAEHSPFRNSPPGGEAQREVIVVARRRAPELAERWLAQMADDAKEAKDDNTARGVFDDRTPRSAVLLQMAEEAVADDPRAAADLAGASLQDGISFALQDVLVKLQAKEPALAQALFERAVERLRAAGTSDPNELLILLAYLYTPGQTRAANTSARRTSFQLAVNPLAPRLVPLGVSNPALAQSFLRLASSLMLSAPLPSATANPAETARTEISAIDALLAYTSRSLPDAAALLQAKVAQIERDANFSPRPSADERRAPPPRSEGESEADYSKRLGAARVDELEDAARKETDQLRRDTAYAEAALATDAEAYERGFELADKISDESLRAGVRDWLAYRASLEFARRGQAERAYELSRKNGDAAQRAAGLVAGARALLKGKGNEERARAWLEEARSLIRKSDPDENWARIAFGVAAAYATLDETLGLESLREAVDVMNKSAEKVDVTVERAPFIRKIGGFREAGINFTYGTGGFGLGAAVRAFRPARFESVLEIVGGISDREARGRAVVVLCRKQLSGADDR
jgi:hypothetical protein